MLQNALAGLERQVESVMGGVALLQAIHHAQALQIVLKTGAFRIMGFQTGVERILPGMPEWRMAEIVRQRYGLDQVFIELQGPGN